MTSANNYVKWALAVVGERWPIAEGVYKGLLKERMPVSHSEHEAAEKSNLGHSPSSVLYATGRQVRGCGAFNMA